MNVGRLLALVSTAKQYYARLADYRVVNPITRPPIDAQLKKSPAKCFAIPRISTRKPVNPNRDPRLGTAVRQFSQPLAEDIFPGGRDVAADFYGHKSIVTYKLRENKSGGFLSWPAVRSECVLIHADNPTSEEG